MDHITKAAKKLGKIDTEKFRYIVLAGCFLASMAMLTLCIPHTVPLLTFSLRFSVPGDQTGLEAINVKYSGEFEPRRTPLCNVSESRSDICDMKGDVRIHGNSSSILFITSSPRGDMKRNESYRIRPYARKGDKTAMITVRTVLVRTSEAAPQCIVKHSVPAIVFSVSGYTGNLFHDFSDILIPLFSTAREFNKEVQFLITNLKPWWIHKFQLVLNQLSKYKVIDFDRDGRVHCFEHVIVGLRSHKELSIDPSRSSNRYYMTDFTEFIRNAYSLDRATPLRIDENQAGKPRLLIIARNRTRAFLNVDEIVHLGEELGYEVVVAEANVSSNVTQFAQMVNSCDVLMGVHGAGLTNLVFLPTNAILIQIVPWGGLKWVAMYDFGEPAKDMKVKYLQYEINPEESSLIEQYPRDHQVFKDPVSFHKQGWSAIRATFMDKQNIRLDAKRFKAVLLKALDLLHQ